MDKNAIKKYAVWARRELIDRVSKRAAVYGITEKDIGDPNADSVNGHLLTAAEKRQRQALIRRIQEKGYQQVMEEVAYTWFNRFAALRFMEVNGYLPTHIRVFTDDEGRFKPQILAEAIHLELDGLNMERIYQLKDANQEEELFKYLLIVQCNALNSILPGMFQKIEDYTELLLPDYLLREGSAIEQMITLIPEDDWKDQVQIIGWLYEAYNTELNTLVYDGTLSKAKIPKELVPAATTIFTPDWPVHYMVENSLGRLWVEGHPSAREKYLPAHNADGSVRVEDGKWNYYLEEAEQESEVQAQLAEIRKEYVALKPEDIIAIDPCAGSGHILCVLFDVLVNIYEDYGYTAREAAASIVQNNLWGLDINDRAAQLAYFAVMMKARQHDRRFFSKGVQPHVYAIQESNAINREHLNYLGRGLSVIERNNAVNQMNALLDEFIDAKEYGSILQPREYDWALLSRFVEDITPMQQMTFDEAGLDVTQAELRIIVAQGQALSQKYHVVVTNPPYLGSNRFSQKLDTYVKANWPDVKSDLSMVMYQHAIDDMALPAGFVSFITTTSWLFLTSFEKLRAHIASIATLSTIVDYGTELFDGKVGHNPIVSWTVRRKYIYKYVMSAVRLVDYCYARRDEKELQFLSGKNRYTAQQDNFSKIPGAPIAYWVSEAMFETFNHHKSGELDYPKQGLSTADNDRFLRFWHEVEWSRISTSSHTAEESKLCGKKWFPFNKGGEYRKWYGNFDYVINWQNDGYELRNYPNAAIRNPDFYFKAHVTWSKVSSGSVAFRLRPSGSVFSDAGCAAIYPDDIVWYCLGLLNTKYAQKVFNIINSTINYTQSTIAALPVIESDMVKENVDRIVQTNVEICKNDWDSFETSWDFQRHPFVIPAIDQHYLRLADCWRDWERACDERFAQLKANEEELNRIFIEIYGLQDELTPEVDDKDVTVRKADLGRDIRSLISYAVGCMLGRYSLDKPGLAFAGGDWQEWLAQQDAMTYVPDKDGILPITDDEYFYDDIVTMFVDWVKMVYGAVTLEENLTFIANALGGKGSPREVIRQYFLNDFYKDHLKIYQKRPIYWLFDSGKKNGFKALVYMHRWQPDTIARVRTDYVHEMQSRYRTAIADVEQRINGASTSERVKLTKHLSALQAQAEELRKYEEKVHHLADQMIGIDLDDGVKVNYAKFADVLAPIK